MSQKIRVLIAKAGFLDVTLMEKHIFTAFHCNKTESFGDVEKFYCTFHEEFPSFRWYENKYKAPAGCRGLQLLMMRP